MNYYTFCKTKNITSYIGPIIGDDDVIFYWCLAGVEAEEEEKK